MHSACAFGTDCDDCGERLFYPPSPPPWTMPPLPAMFPILDPWTDLEKNLSWYDDTWANGTIADAEKEGQKLIAEAEGMATGLLVVIVLVILLVVGLVVLTAYCLCCRQKLPRTKKLNEVNSIEIDPTPPPNNV